MRKTSKKTLTNKLDKSFRELILARDKVCQRCGKTDQLQCCHIKSRTYRSTRWLPENATILCAGCHFWGHKNPLDFAFWYGGKYKSRCLLIKTVGAEIFKTSIQNLTAKLGEIEKLKEDI